MPSYIFIDLFWVKAFKSTISVNELEINGPVARAVFKTS